MTNHWIDFKNADVVLAIGGNNAENHPISMKWVQEAKNNGAKYVVVDPRFTRSAAVADLYAPLRSGTDLAFYGGLYNYIFENKLYNEEYVKAYTNASYILKDTYSFADGLFSGYNAEKKTYDKSKWAYDIAEEVPWDITPTGAYSWVTKPGTPAFTPLVNKKAKKDATLQDPTCVFQQMKKHYSRYTPELVSSITGMPKDLLLKVYETYASTGAKDKAGTILYAMGQTQHTYGSQNCRAMSVLQLLLGNMGIPGGGVNALRGESNVQGSTDMGLLYGSLTGYLNLPDATKHPTIASYIEKETQTAGFWANRPKFFISMLKEFYGTYATLENNYAYEMIPKLDGKNHSHIAMFEEMSKGTIEGLFLWGQNPAVGGPNCRQERKALEKLKWMVAIDLWETETAQFWKAPNIDPAKINTEVFLLPAAAHFEKQGEVANSGRWIQWRWKAVDPPGEAKDDLEIVTEFVLALQKLYGAEGGANPEQITKLNWDYLTDGKADITKVALGVNGYVIDPATGKPKDGKGLASFANLAADGSTASGCWIYTGYFTGFYEEPDPADATKKIAKLSMDPAKMKTGSRNNVDKPLDADMPEVGNYLGWSWAWPLNRRIIYNRCAADTTGKPWNESKAIMKWNGTKWVRGDVPDFAVSATAPDGTVTPTPPEKTLAYMMTQETVGRLWAPSMNEGPFPEHYEPFESPVDNLMSPQQTNPAVSIVESAAATLGTPDKFPIVMTTFRLTEHWQTGQLTRNLPWLVETMPKMFVELSPSLADEKGIVSGDEVVIENNRGTIIAYAMVTDRIKPFDIGGKKVHQIAAPWHWGYSGACSVGGIANDLTPNVGDANTSIPEYKAFLVNIRKQEV